MRRYTSSARSVTAFWSNEIEMWRYFLPYLLIIQSIIHVCRCVYVCVCMCVLHACCMCVYICLHVSYMCIYAYVCVCVCIHVCVHVQLCMSACRLCGTWICVIYISVYVCVMFIGWQYDLMCVMCGRQATRDWRGAVQWTKWWVSISLDK